MFGNLCIEGRSNELTEECQLESSSNASSDMVAILALPLDVLIRKRTSKQNELYQSRSHFFYCSYLRASCLYSFQMHTSENAKVRRTSKSMNLYPPAKGP